MSDAKEPTSIAGLAAIVVLLEIGTGLTSLLVGLVALLHESEADFVGGGLGLLGAALAFGLLANALLRD